MRYLCWGIILLCFPLWGMGQSEISLQEAVEKGWVASRVVGLGGYNGVAIELSLKSRTSSALKVEVPAGWTFGSEDSSVQNLMVTYPVVIDLPPRGVARDSLRTVCTQRNNMGPKRGERFRIGEMASQRLRRLAGVI
ncbi:MAG: hypothetical protein AAFV07_19255, partial [Bacteroidota bacterium]